MTFFIDTCTDKRDLSLIVFLANLRGRSCYIYLAGRFNSNDIDKYVTTEKFKWDYCLGNKKKKRNTALVVFFFVVKIVYLCLNCWKEKWKVPFVFGPIADPLWLNWFGLHKFLLNLVGENAFLRASIAYNHRIWHSWPFFSYKKYIDTRGQIQRQSEAREYKDIRKALYRWLFLLITLLLVGYGALNLV